jgi:hypothetical protein
MPSGIDGSTDVLVRHSFFHANVVPSATLSCRAFSAIGYDYFSGWTLSSELFRPGFHRSLHSFSGFLQSTNRSPEILISTSLVFVQPPSASAPNLRSSASSEDIRGPGMPPLSPNHAAAPPYGPPPTFFDPSRKPSNFPLPSSSYPPPQFYFPTHPAPVNHPRLATSYSAPNHFPANIPFSPPNFISPGFAPGFTPPQNNSGLARHQTYPQFPLPPAMPAPMTSSLAPMTSSLSRHQQMAAAAAAATEMVRATSYERLHDLAGASASEQ